MKKVSRSSPSLTRDGKHNCPTEDYESPTLEISRDASSPLNASTPCLAESRPSSSIGEWEEPWMANSDSCLVSSSSGASPLTGTSSQGVSPDGMNAKVFSFQKEDQKADRSLSSINDALQTEKDFMDYVMSFPVGDRRSCSMDSKKNSTDASPKVGLDHLDNLCKLMEQLSDLKETNVKLKRRVQYLEDLKTLHEIHREMIGASPMGNTTSSKDYDHQNAGLKYKPNPNHGRSPHQSRGEEDDDDFREFVTGLYRSKTTTHVETRLEPKRETGHRSRNDAKVKARERSKSVGHSGHSKGKKRASRWSKVKEVLGIEKTDSRVRNEQDGSDEDGEKGMDDIVFIETNDRHRFDAKRKKDSTSRSRNALQTTGSFSKSSDLKQDTKTGYTECTNKPLKAFTHMEQYEQGNKKSPKTPWGRMKTIIQSRRDCRTGKSESSSSSSRGTHPEKAAAGTNSTIGEENGGNRRSARSRKSSFTLQDVPKRHQNEDKCTLVSYNGIPTEHQAHVSEKRSPSRQKAVEHDIRLRPHQNDRETHTTQKVDKSSQKATVPLKDPADSADKSTLQEDTKSPVFALQKAPSSKRVPSISPSVAQKQNSVPDNCSQQVDHSGVSSPVCATATVTELLKELQQNLSDDFNRKLEEWQRFRGENSKPPQGLDVERKDSFGRFRKFSKPEKKVSSSEKSTKSQPTTPKKDLNWLDKELPKVEREILRLSKEKQKYEKRAFRLQLLKEAMTESQSRKEVLVRTSAGEFRFEGISNAFTKKLYEWETKKGVGPELSTIALLDESLKTQEPETPRESSSTEKLLLSMVATSEPNERTNYQKASSEPDLSTLMSASQKDSDSSSALTSYRSKSRDTLLATGSSKESDLSHSRSEVDPENKGMVEPTDVTRFVEREENYCTLLEENMFLLDQLKMKEDICTKLQNELDRLDEKSDKANKVHKDELETYRQKLWEIHMSRPRDLQGSLQLISELKTRIEELEKCSDKLKCDREKLEASFKYHSEQQSRLTDNLLRRMVELHDSGPIGSTSRTGQRRKCKNSNCDTGCIAKIHELSTKLLKQARDMEKALAERTRQVCHLRWELLHRDMSAVLLQAALHRVTCQGPQAALLPTWNMKRIKFKELKAWSIDTTTRRQSENMIAEDWLQERLKQLSLAPYNEWTSIDFNPNDLMDTVHELKKETFRMSSNQTGQSDSEDRKKHTSCSAESEIADSDRNYDTGSAFNSRSSSFSSGPGGGLRGSHSDTRLYERSRSLSMHRNSSSSMSCVSGFDASESSSVHDSDRIHQQLLSRGTNLWNRKKRNRVPSRENENVSSSCSSRSSGLEEETVWDPQEKDEDNEDSRQRCMKYESLCEADEENIEYTESYPSSSHNQCLITPRPITIGACSDGTNCTQNGPTYSILKSLISHPSYTRAATCKSTQDSVFQDDTSASTRPYIDNFKMQYSDGRDECGISHNSSAYTSVESLENCNYVTLTEQQLFQDIRNLAISCESDSGKIEHNVGISQLAEESNVPVENRFDLSTSSEYSMIRKSTPDITQIRYKGTKGFGRSSRIDFQKYSAGSSTQDIQATSSWKSREKD